MTEDQMRRLQPGEIIRSKSGDENYVVTANYGSRVTAARTVDVTNPEEWYVVGQCVVCPLCGKRRLIGGIHAGVGVRACYGLSRSCCIEFST